MALMLILIKPWVPGVVQQRAVGGQVYGGFVPQAIVEMYLCASPVTARGGANNVAISTPPGPLESPACIQLNGW